MWLETRKGRKDNKRERTYFFLKAQRQNCKQRRMQKKKMLLKEYLWVDKNYESVKEMWVKIHVLSLRKEMMLGGRPSTAPGISVALLDVLAVVWMEEAYSWAQVVQELRAPNYLSIPCGIGVHLIFPTELQIREGRIVYFMPFSSLFHMHHRCSANTCRRMNESINE